MQTVQRMQLDSLKWPTGTAGDSRAWYRGFDPTVPSDISGIVERALAKQHEPVCPIQEVADHSEREKLRDAATALRDVAAYTVARPTSSRLPFSYRAIPGPVRAGLAHAMGRLQRMRQSQWARFPRFPIDLSADLLADLAGLNNRVSLHGKTPVILSHDLDSPEGVANALDLFAPIESRYGAAAAQYVVPCAWPLDHARLSELKARGHEIGVHGFDHSNLTPYAPAAERRRRLDAAAEFRERYGSAGYRAPSLVRTRELLADLATRYAYDSSIPTSGGLFPVPNNGSATARPYKIGNLWELPLSLPRDGSLRFLGYSADEILKLWLESLDLVRQSGGVAILLTHCEARFSGNKRMLYAYEKFLAAVTEEDHFVFTTPQALTKELSANQ